MAIRSLLFLVMLPFCLAVQAQEISFSNLSIGNGLSDNFIKSMAVDKNGFLWIGTADGLNVYDGYSITTFSTNENPAIPSNTITNLFCDSHNRVWMASAEGCSWVDEKRNFHRVLLNDTVSAYSCKAIFETKNQGVVLYTSLGQFIYEGRSKSWMTLDDLPAGFGFKHYRDAIAFDEDKILFATDSCVMIWNYLSNNMIYQQAFTNIVSACRVSGDTIAVADNKGLLRLINISSKQIIKEYQVKAEFDDKLVNTWISEVRMAANGDILMGTYQSGMVTIGRDGIMKTYRHEPTNSRSVAYNYVSRVLGTPNGDVIAGTWRSGLSICNIFNRQAGYNKFFNDRNGNFYDAFLSDMAEDRDGSILIGGNDRLIRWNRKTNISEFYQYKARDTAIGPRTLEFYRVCIDKAGRIWAGLLYGGFASVDRVTRTVNLVPMDTSLSSAVRSKFVYDIYEASDGMLWVATREGFFKFDPRTRKPDVFKNNPGLQAISNKLINAFVEDHSHRIWISTNCCGLYCYDPKNNTVRNFTKKDGLLDDMVLELLVSRNGDLYGCNYKGIVIITPDGKISGITKADGLRYNRCESLAEDKEGNIWAANTKCVIKYDPSTKKITIYDEKAGLSLGGFYPGSAFCAKDGQLLWGTQGGINFFYPDRISDVPEPLHVSIYQVLAGDTLINATADSIITLPYRKNNVQFFFAGINLKGSRNIRYEYKLEGFDDQWQVGTDIKQARYSSLPPGKYVFRLRASADRVNWIEPANTVRLQIIAPLWKRWWFRVLLILFILLGIYAFYRYRLLQAKKVHELQLTASNLEKEKTEILYQNLMNQFNPHFLFNSLTSLNSLIYDNQELASEFLEHLSKVYRYLLTHKENRLVSIEEEIDFVESYISLLKIRFEKGLTVTLDIPPVHRNRNVVPVTFQILIENAIKHNVIDPDSPLHIRFTTEGDYITVSNNIQLKGYVETSNKKGLSSLQTMYHYLSPNPLLIEEKDGQFIIRVPLI